MFDDVETKTSKSQSTIATQINNTPQVCVCVCAKISFFYVLIRFGKTDLITFLDICRILGFMLDI